jgi:hypothetical protein
MWIKKGQSLKIKNHNQPDAKDSEKQKGTDDLNQRTFDYGSPPTQTKKIIESPDRINISYQKLDND